MTITNLNCNSSEHRLTWTAQGKEHKMEIEQLYFATLKGNIILAEAGENFVPNQVLHIRGHCEVIFKSTKSTGNIYWKNGKKEVNITLEGLEQALIFSSSKLILSLSIINGNLTLSAFKLNGSKAFETPAPDGYQFQYLSSINDQPTVVCTSQKLADQYGRNSFNFEINPKTGKLSKGSLAY